MTAKWRDRNGSNGSCLGRLIRLLDSNCVLPEKRKNHKRFNYEPYAIERADAPETIFEPPGYILEMRHPASPGGLSTLSLQPPVVAPKLG